MKVNSVLGFNRRRGHAFQKLIYFLIVLSTGIVPQMLQQIVRGEGHRILNIARFGLRIRNDFHERHVFIPVRRGRQTMLGRWNDGCRLMHYPALHLSGRVLNRANPRALFARGLSLLSGDEEAKRIEIPLNLDQVLYGLDLGQRQSSLLFCSSCHLGVRAVASFCHEWVTDCNGLAVLLSYKKDFKLF